MKPANSKTRASARGYNDNTRAGEKSAATQSIFVKILLFPLAVVSAIFGAGCGGDPVRPEPDSSNNNDGGVETHPTERVPDNTITPEPNIERDTNPQDGGGTEITPEPYIEPKPPCIRTKPSFQLVNTREGHGVTAFLTYNGNTILITSSPSSNIASLWKVPERAPNGIEFIDRISDLTFEDNKKPVPFDPVNMQISSGQILVGYNSTSVGGLAWIDSSKWTLSKLIPFPNPLYTAFYPHTPTLFFQTSRTVADKKTHHFNVAASLDKKCGAGTVLRYELADPQNTSTAGFTPANTKFLSGYFPTSSEVRLDKAYLVTAGTACTSQSPKSPLVPTPTTEPKFITLLEDPATNGYRVKEDQVIKLTPPSGHAIVKTSNGLILFPVDATKAPTQAIILTDQGLIVMNLVENSQTYHDMSNIPSSTQPDRLNPGEKFIGMHLTSTKDIMLFTSANRVFTKGVTTPRPVDTKEVRGTGEPAGRLFLDSKDNVFIPTRPPNCSDIEITISGDAG